MDNLLQDTDKNLTFEQYAVSDYWDRSTDENGDPTLSTSLQTVQGVAYELEFNLAANLSADVESVTVEVYFNGASIGTFTHTGGVFEPYTFDLIGTGDLAELEFRITDVVLSSDSSIDTSGFVASYSKTMTFLGQEVTVDAFAPGQNAIYQVLNGQLVKFDLETNSYTQAEVSAAVNSNAIGYSNEDDLIYGIARSDGVDAVGNAINVNDVIAIDAKGATYAVSPGTMGSYIGDVDDKGNLWIFSGNLRTAVVYDLSRSNPDGTLVSSSMTLPTTGVPTSGLADLAYHAASQTFFGVAHGGSTGQPGTLVAIDVSEVALGGDAIVTTRTIAGTIVDGEIKSGIPSGAFGATIVDGDGNVYVGANNTDHDLDGATPNSGGFYKITTGADGALYMELLADAPQVSSNDGAMDTRGLDPFLGIDDSSAILLRAPVISVAIAEDDSLRLAAKGDPVMIDLLANDEVGEGDSLTVTHLGGIEVSAGAEIILANGEVVTYLGDGLIRVTPGSLPRNVTAELTYTIRNEGGVTDTATLTVDTSPVQGGADNDHMVGFTDDDGTSIDGVDGLDDVILGYGGNDKIYAGDGDDDIYGGAGSDFIRGQAGNDLIYGEAGNDVLDGGTGMDTMHGGAGNDIYFVDAQGDVVSEAGGDGTDTVKSQVDYELGEGLENLWLLRDPAALRATGNALGNMMVGNENDNFLEGLGGNDNLIGAEGNDTIFGGAGNDKLHGDEGDDVLDGGAGNDKLHGGTGNDTTYGGDGDDTLCPGEGDDVMFGGAGRDLLSGNAGADIAYGGLGDDTYKVSDAFDTIIEYAGEGHDVVHATADFSLSDNVEDIYFFEDGDFSGSGNADANRMVGNTGSNTLAGGAGDDHIDGQAGDDVLCGDAGRDYVLGNSGADKLDGGEGDDTLSGGDGDDVLIGGLGNDFMCGDSGADVFAFAIGDGCDEIKAFDVDLDSIMLADVNEADFEWIAGSRGLLGVYGDTDSFLLCGIDAEMAAGIELIFI
ncbi:MAG: calcium-binding protein [Chromatiales bacterium]|jgi:Ca2+-binding RTX toxin-like protein